MASRRKKKAGRKLKLDTIPGLTKALAKLIREGMPIKYACDLVGLDNATFNRYIERAEEEPRFRAFRTAITRARASKVRRLLKKIEAASEIPNMVTGQVDVKPLQWVLERTEQGEFSPKTKTEVTGKDGGPVQFDTVSDVLARARAARAKREGK